MQTVLVADALCELQRANLTTSLREIYYRTKHTIKNSHENTLDTQDESDPLIEDLEVTLAALREELHVRAENAGSIVGPLVLVDDGDRVDCARSARAAIRSVDRRAGISRDQAMHRRFRPAGREGDPVEPPLGGQVLANAQLRAADRQRAAAARRPATGAAASRGEAPARHVLVDNDPWGYYIYSVIKQGSINLAFESQRMAIRRPSSWGSRARTRKLRAAAQRRHQTERQGQSRARRELLGYTWFQKKDWQTEIKRMLSSGLKYELDALANKDFQFLTKKYLARKLKEKDWLD